MNVYDKIYDLANALKICPETLELKEALDKINLDEKNKKILIDFRNVQMVAYKEYTDNGEISKEIKEKIDNLSRIIDLNSDISTYMRAEAKLATLWENMMKILTEAIDIDINLEE